MNKPQETVVGLNQKVSSQVEVFLYGLTRIRALSVYRADLTHPVMFMEHGKAVSPSPVLHPGTPHRKAGQGAQHW